MWGWSRDDALWLRVSSGGPGSRRTGVARRPEGRSQPGARSSRAAKTEGPAPPASSLVAGCATPGAQSTRVGAVPPAQSSATPIQNKLRARTRSGRDQSHPPQWVAWRPPAEAVAEGVGGPKLQEKPLKSDPQGPGQGRQLGWPSGAGRVPGPSSAGGAEEVGTQERQLSGVGDTGGRQGGGRAAAGNRCWSQILVTRAEDEPPKHRAGRESGNGEHAPPPPRPGQASASAWTRSRAGRH